VRLTAAPAPGFGRPKVRKPADPRDWSRCLRPFLAPGHVIRIEDKDCQYRPQYVQLVSFSLSKHLGIIGPGEELLGGLLTDQSRYQVANNLSDGTLAAEERTLEALGQGPGSGFAAEAVG
jgi:hypothetical protein